MADDYQDKTEEATQKKLQDSRKKGQVAKSQDLNSSIVLLVGMGSLGLFASFLYNSTFSMTIAVFNNLNYELDSTTTIINLAREGLYFTAFICLPVIGCIFVAAILSNLAQFGFMISTDPLKPKWKNLNIFNPKQYQKFFSTQALMRLVFGLSKLAVIAVVSSVIIWMFAPSMTRLMEGTPAEMFLFLFEKGFYIGLAICIILLFLGVMEFTYQKWKFTQDMKMTKQEVKDERKQTEGDVQVKQKMRSMMQSFAQTRMKANVPHADVIIANPIHYAIAIKYDSDVMPAPVCVAKGARKMALAIKEIAKEHDVPIVENPFLAQGLYKTVEVGSLIPPEFYHSVAEVLAYVYRLNETMEERLAKMDS